MKAKVLNPRGTYTYITHCFTHAGTYNPGLQNRRIISKSTSVNLASCQQYNWLLLV